MSDDWDVDSYKSEFENEEHWQLRRNFMLAHKDKFPEDELVCLAQVFTNIEFMGCRYPDETMIRVAELGKGVVEKYREQRKNLLKRTFVAASDAASAKVKGSSSKYSGFTGRVCKGEELVSPKKSKKMDYIIKDSEEVQEVIIIEETNTKVETSSTRVPKYGGVKTFNIKKNAEPETNTLNKSIDETDSVNKSDTEVNSIPESSRPLGDFVLVLSSSEEHPVSIVQRNSLLNKCTIRWDFEEGFGGIFVCKLFLNNKCIATSTGANMKMSKEYTAMVAIAKLRESYYGIRVKSRFFSDTIISPAQLGSSSKTLSDSLGEDNIGRKLMKLMGWQGGGIGSKGQGREDPVTTALKVKRDRFGLGSKTSNLVEFKKQAREYVRAWMKSNSDQDLVFSTDFNVEERKILHEVASNFSLKSKSHGKDSNRHLVISRKSDPWDILKELLRAGGNSDRYELLYPTNNT